MLILLVACGQNDAGRAAIVQRCLDGGEAADVCQCLAYQSARKLDREMFDLVVLGAVGEEAETDLMVAEMSPERQTKFAAAIREITQTCRAAGDAS